MLAHLRPRHLRPHPRRSRRRQDRPEQVADNPLLFATFTAPSFGLVHGHRGGRPCRPRRRDDRTRCPHGRPQWCTTIHEPGDARSGAPLCPDCYDTASAVIWQWHAPNCGGARPSPSVEPSPDTSG
ncbi:replication initiator [Phycicoccus sp. HDW14]|uniref:replication initiator n=1 Tax=Phycicoccus sp. HDW14 TaxID=2714941 RepID=UPI0035301281